jgi:hypothetical protein
MERERGIPRREQMKKKFHSAIVVLLSILFLSASGCETKSRARLEAQQAYVAGQEQVLQQSRPKPQIVTVTGPVRNSIIPWTEDMTLSKAYKAAEYTGYIRPRLLRITSEGQTAEIKFSLLLDGRDMPLEPGDIIEVVP